MWRNTTSSTRDTAAITSQKAVPGATFVMRRNPSGASQRRSSAACDVRFQPRPIVGWRFASPSPKSVRESTHLLVPKKPRDPRHGEASILKIPKREVTTHFVKDAGKAQPFVRQPSSEGSLAAVELLGNLAQPGLTMGKNGCGYVLDARTARARFSASVCERPLRNSHQHLIEVRVCADKR